MIYAQLLQVNPPNPAVCHGTLRRHSQDQAHGTAARAEQRRRGACFPSTINAVRSSADVCKTSRTRGLLLRGHHRRDTRTAQVFKDQRASVFASSLDTTQVHCKPSKTRGLLLHEQPHRRSDAGADGLKPRQMCFSRTLCEMCVADFLRPANMRYLQVGQKVGVARYIAKCAV